MPASNYVETTLLKLFLKGTTAPAAPTKAFLALCENEVGKTMTGKEVSEALKGAELTYTGYKRTEILLEAATWEETAGGEATASKLVNKTAVSLPLNTVALSGKENAKFWALCEKEKGSETGNVFFTGKFEKEVTITSSLTKVEIEAKKLEIAVE